MGSRVITVLRSCVRGDARFHASITFGAAAAAASGARSHITIGNVRKSTSTIAGH
jgi:hypothetical protein